MPEPGAKSAEERSWGSSEGSAPIPGPSAGRGAWLWLVLLALLLAFAWQGTRGLSDPDEGRYAEVAREMLQTGDFLHPQLDFQPHYTKPPLSYWSIAASIALFGPSEWAVRLFQSVAYLATILLVALTGRRLWGGATGRLAGVIYASMLLPFVAANIVTTDTLLTLWEALAVFAFFEGRAARSPTARAVWPAVTGLAFGLAFFTKGPPGLLFLLAFWADWWFSPRGHGRRTPVLNALGVALLLVVGLSWFVYVTATKPGLMSYFLGDEVAGRIAGEHHRNAGLWGAIKIYLPTLTLGALPWSLSWPVVWRRIGWGRGNQSLWRQLLERPAARALVLLVLLPLLVFVVSRSRLPLYLLPLFIPISLGTARGLDLARVGSAPARILERPRWRWSLVAWVLVLLGLRLGYALWPNEADARALSAQLPTAGVDEIVVTDGVRPVHGLAFYTRRGLEYAAWSAEQAKQENRPELDEVLEQLRADPSLHFLVLMKTGAKEKFMALARQHEVQTKIVLEGKKIVAGRCSSWRPD